LAVTADTVRLETPEVAAVVAVLVVDSFISSVTTSLEAARAPLTYLEVPGVMVV
jgi:hypothetical protein